MLKFIKAFVYWSRVCVPLIWKGVLIWGYTSPEEVRAHYPQEWQRLKEIIDG